MNDRRSFLLNIQDFILNTKPAKYYTRAPPTLSDEKVSFTADVGWNMYQEDGRKKDREREMDGKEVCRACPISPSSEFAATETNFHLNESGRWSRRGAGADTDRQAGRRNGVEWKAARASQLVSVEKKFSDGQFCHSLAISQSF